MKPSDLTPSPVISAQQALSASDAFVVPWEPRALDCHPRE